MEQIAIAKFFNSHFKITQGHKTQPYLILFDAYIGYGKSYISHLISQLDKSIIIDNNEVRYVLNDYNDDKAEIWHDLQNERIKNLLAAGNSLIIDECLPINPQKKLDFIRSLGYPFYIIRLDISENVLKKRLHNRKLDPPKQYSVINYRDATAIRDNSHGQRLPDYLIDYAIDSDKNVEQQVNDFVAKFELNK